MTSDLYVKKKCFVEKAVGKSEYFVGE